MKAIRLLATTLLCAATTVAVNAQENLKKAIDSFINDKSLSEYFHRSNYLENTGPENKVSSFCDQYVFAMAVIMVAGNQPRVPSSILEGVRTLTTNIVLEMGYAADLHREALIATAVVLFVFILLINALFAAVKRRQRI